MLAALFSAGSATAASPGIGTSLVGTTVAQLDLGGVLSARVLGDDSRSTIDKSVVSVPEAAMVLRPLTITSGALPLLNQEIAPVETRTQSGEKKTDYSTDLGNLLLPQIVDGSLTPATLSAIVDAAGARAGMLDTLTNLVVAGGLVSVDSIKADLSTTAAKESSTSNRTLDVGAISALNLGALLAGLGLPVNALSLPTVESLTQQLGLLGAGNPVAGLLTTLGIGGAVPTDAAGLNTLVTGLDTALDTASANLASLQATIAGALGGVCGAVPLLDAVALPLGLPSGTTCAAGLATLTGNQTAAAGDLGGLLSGLLSMLDGIDLLNVSGVDAGITSTATDAVGTSVAKVTAAIGDIKVANLATIPGVDLANTAAQITGAVDTVTGQLDAILGTVSPQLAGLVNLELLDTTGTGVTKTPTGYVRSVANLTGVDLSIVPPDLTAIIAGLPVVGSSVGGLLTAVPGFSSLPALPGTAGMGALNTLLGGASSPVDALESGARLRLASVGGVAEFLPATAGAPATPSDSLPRTGGTSGLTGFAIAAAVMALLGLGIRRQVLAPARVD